MPRILTCALLVFLASFAGNVFAESISNEDLMKEMRELRDVVKAQSVRISQLEAKLAEKDKTAASAPEPSGKDMACIRQCLLPDIKDEVKCAVDSELKKRDIRIADQGYTIPGGLNIGADGTFVFQGTPNANKAGEGEDDRFDGGWSADIEITKDFCYDESGKGLVLMLIETGDNDILGDDLNLFSFTNYDIDNSDSMLRLTELWYEHHLFDGQLILRGGKIDVASRSIDTNAFANDETSQFLSDMFRNSPVIEYATGSNGNRVPGGSVMIKPACIKYVELTGGYFNADGSWDQIFSHPFYTGEINLMPDKLMEWDEEQWGGNYRLYYWGNDRKHTKIVEYGVDPNTGTTDVSTRLNRANYGFGMSLDQKITDVYGVFGRAGWQRPELVPIAGTATLYAAWSAGAQMTGKYWNRTDDVLGAAIGTVYPSERYSSSTDPGRPSSPETHFETYYNIRINPHLSISPDLQWIWDPFGVGRADQGDHDAIFIYGLRCQLDF